MFATFKDGSGNQKDADGQTLADWRQIERCFAELLNGTGGEDKNIFDVIANDPSDSTQAYGFSIKSKQLPIKQFDSLASGGRVYMEIANSPAKFWAEINSLHSYTEADFREQKHANAIGNTVIQTVMKWHQEGKSNFDAENPGVSLDLNNSCYLCVTSSKESSDSRRYQVHSFDLSYPAGIIWRYKSSACLTGYDPQKPSEPLIDWYGLSGGQLKYYPSTSSSKYSTGIFTVPNPPRSMTIQEKVELYFPS